MPSIDLEAERDRALQTIFIAINKMDPLSDDLAHAIGTDQKTATRLIRRENIGNMKTKWLIAKAKLLKRYAV